MSWRSIARKVALSLVTLIVLLGIAELVARAMEPGPMSLVDSNPYLEHADLHHVHNPGFSGRWDGTWYEINAHGWRGPEYEPAFSDDEYRVVALGDSCTFGKGVDESQTWPRQLEHLLQEALGPDRKAMVANLGVNGYSSRHYVQVFEEQGLAIKPDLVVLGYNLNDFPNLVQRVDRAVYQGRKNLRAKIPWRLRENLGQSALYRWLRAAYYEWNRERDWANVEKLAGSVGETNPEYEERFRRDAELLERIVSASREAGAEVVIFLFPYESMVYLDSFSTVAIDRVRELARELEVDFVNHVDTFRTRAQETDPPKRLFLRGDRYHPNEEGYGIVAQSVVDVVRRQGWLNPD